MTEAPPTPVDRLVLVLSLPLVTLAGLAIVDALGQFDFYPTLDPVVTGPALIAAGIAMAVTCAAAAGLRR
jgi:hypothetical protein